METMQVYCVKAHTYDGHKRTPGDPMTIRRRHFAVLKGLRRVSEDAPKVVTIPIGRIVPGISIATPSEPLQDARKEIADNLPDNDEKALREALRVEYKELFGKNAPGRASVETIRAEIERKKAGE